MPRRAGGLLLVGPGLALVAIGLSFAGLGVGIVPVPRAAEALAFGVAVLLSLGAIVRGLRIAGLAEAAGRVPHELDLVSRRSRWLALASLAVAAVVGLVSAPGPARQTSPAPDRLTPAMVATIERLQRSRDPERRGLGDLLAGIARGGLAVRPSLHIGRVTPTLRIGRLSFSLGAPEVARTPRCRCATDPCEWPRTR